MKMIAIIDVPDDMYDDYKGWYIITCFDDLEKRRKEDNAYMNFKTLGGELKLKPLPEYQEEKMPNYVNDYEYERGWNNCLDEILGE